MIFSAFIIFPDSIRNKALFLFRLFEVDFAKVSKCPHHVSDSLRLILRLAYLFDQRL